MNELKHLKTIQRFTSDGPAYAIMIAVDLYDLNTAPAFVHEVLEKFKIQWMIGPPQPTQLLVTVIGEVSADQFIGYWHEKTVADPVLKTITSLLHVADVWRGSPTGEILEQETLLFA